MTRVPHFQPALAGPSDAEVEAASAVIAAREAALGQQARDTLVQCTSQLATGKGCGGFSRVGDLTFIQTHFYIEPHGCTGGDYWRAGEGQFVCPLCGHRNRLYDSPEVTKLKPAFKAVEDRHDG